jgi:DNA-binding NtrC family response regulator
MRQSTILLVDDDPFILSTLGPAIAGYGYQVETAATGESAVELFEKDPFDLVITDLVMKEADGIDVLKKSKEADPETAVIILTGHGNLASAINAIRLDADDYILKPCDIEEILFRVGRCIERQELRRKVKTYETILPVCCVCKRIRDDTGKEPGAGEWLPVEAYIWRRTKVDVTSTFCPECFAREKEKLDRV